jgi:hypothetical protein
VSASAPSNGASGGVIQRQCSSCATGNHKCAKCQEEDDEAAQRAPSSSSRAQGPQPGGIAVEWKKGVGSL